MRRMAIPRRPLLWGDHGEMSSIALGWMRHGSGCAVATGVEDAFLLVFVGTLRGLCRSTRDRQFSRPRALSPAMAPVQVALRLEGDLPQDVHLFGPDAALRRADLELHMLAG